MYNFHTCNFSHFLLIPSPPSSDLSEPGEGRLARRHIATARQCILSLPRCRSPAVPSPAGFHTQAQKHTNTSTPTQAHQHKHTSTQAHKCTGAQAHKHKHTSGRTNSHAHISMRTYTHTCACAPAHAHMRMHAYARTRTHYTHAHSPNQPVKIPPSRRALGLVKPAERRLKLPLIPMLERRQVESRC